MNFIVAAIIFAFAATTTAAWSIQDQEDLDQYRPECVQFVQVPDDHVNVYKMENFPNDDKTQCYVRCMLSKMGFFNDRTGFHVDRLVTQLGKDKTETDIKSLVEKCADNNSLNTGTCEWAYRGFYCIRQAKLRLHL